MAIKNTRFGGTDWVDGEVLYAADLNDTFDATNKLLISNVAGSVSNGDFITYNLENSEWEKASEFGTPVGVYAGSNTIILSGYSNLFTGLTPFKFYYVDGDGNLSTDVQATKAGFSISATELIIDIDVTQGFEKGERGLFGGGTTGSVTNVIDYISLSTLGNATDFGNLTIARSGSGACSSSTRGLFGGGTTGSASNVIDYVTIATTGDATDFGNLDVPRYYLAGCSSSTRGIFGGGNTGSVSNVIDYVTIASTGDATDFGNLDVARNQNAGCSSSTRGIFAGGET